jgi:hypothetical protein
VASLNVVPLESLEMSERRRITLSFIILLRCSFLSRHSSPLCHRSCVGVLPSSWIGSASPNRRNFEQLPRYLLRPIPRSKSTLLSSGYEVRPFTGLRANTGQGWNCVTCPCLHSVLDVCCETKNECGYEATLTREKSLFCSLARKPRTAWTFAGNEKPSGGFRTGNILAGSDGWG